MGYSKPVHWPFPTLKELGQAPIRTGAGSPCSLLSEIPDQEFILSPRISWNSQGVYLDLHVPGSNVVKAQVQAGCALQPTNQIAIAMDTRRTIQLNFMVPPFPRNYRINAAVRLLSTYILVIIMKGFQ